MVRQPPRSPRTDTLCPYATRSRSRHDFQELYEILPDAFSVAPSISRSEAAQLFRKALIRFRRTGPLTADAMIEHAGAIHRVALAVPRRKFTMCTKFRAQNMFHTPGFPLAWDGRSNEHTSELQSLLRSSYSVFCLKTN